MKMRIRLEDYQARPLFRLLTFPVYLVIAAIALIRSLFMRVYPGVYRRDLYIIGIGNLDVGGTGKTPLELEIARLFMGHVNIVTRGYRRRIRSDIFGTGETLLRRYHAAEIGDEAWWLAQALPEAYFCITRDKDHVLRHHTFPYTITIVDDAFHRFRVRQQRRICVLDAATPLGTSALLPWGRRRHLLNELSFADIVCFHRVNYCSPTELKTNREIAGRIAPHARFLFCAYSPMGLKTRGSTLFPMELLASKKILAFCGIARPHYFFSILEPYALSMETIILPDHAVYDTSLLNNLSEALASNRYDYLVTTEKDWVKLSALYNDPCLLALIMKITWE